MLYHPSESIMKPQLDRVASNLAYLEPPHSHDPTSVSDVASLPLATLQALPEPVQQALYNLQQSTSIVYASYVRLQDALEERFERLCPSLDADGEYSFAEPSFMTYANSLFAERTYLLSDALPDWRHKASLARVAIQPYYDLSIYSGGSGSPHNILEWWSALESAVTSWCDHAKVVHVPDYEDTVGEYLAIQKQLPSLSVDLDESPWETPQAVSTPMSEQEMQPFHIPELKEDFTPPALSENAVPSEAAGLGLTGATDMKGFVKAVPREFLLHQDRKLREDRKDSGVGMHT